MKCFKHFFCEFQERGCPGCKAEDKIQLEQMKLIDAMREASDRQSAVSAQKPPSGEK